MKLKLFSAAFVAASAIASAANASLVGDEVACDIEPSSIWSCSAPTATVGAGTEFEFILDGSGTFFEVDIDASSVLLDFTNSGGLGAGAGEVLTLSSLDWVGDPSAIITGIANFTTSGVTGFTLDDIVIAGNSLIIDLNGTDWSPGDFASFDLVYGEVPLPAALPLFLAGLAGFGAAARRKHKTA